MFQARWSDSPIIWISVVLVLLIGAVLRLSEISQYPQGFHYDEAVNMVLVREIVEYGARPFPVFAAFNGREVFYHYINAGASIFFGRHIFTMHLVSAFMNWITLATIIGLGYAMFGKPRGLVIGLIAAGFMAVSFPQIFIARQAFRAVSLPLLQACCLWTLFMGLRRNKWLWLITSGVFGAVALYTYMASRLFPVWLSLILAALWLFDRHHRRQRFKQGVVVIGVLLITAFPIIHYYATHQDVFADRLSQLSGTSDTPTYAESIRLHLKMFFIEGDPYIRYNEPFAPYFDPIGGFLLVLGLGVSVWQIFYGSMPVARAAYLIIACAPLMVIPSILAVGGLPPSHMRSIGMVPLIFFLPALGVDFLWSLTQAKLPQLLPPVVAWGIFVVMALWVWNRYENWASNPEMFYLADGDMVAAGDWLETHIDEDTLMYVTALHYDHPSLVMHDLPGDNITFLLGNRLFFPPPNREAYLIETRNSPLPISLRHELADFEKIDGTNGPDGQPSFTIYHWELKADSFDITLVETIGGWVSFVDSELPIAIAGEKVTITTQWHIFHAPIYDDFTPIFQLETLYGDVLSRDEPFTQKATQWRVGETLIQQAQFTIPMGTPPGDYPVRVTWVGRSADQYVGRIDPQGNFAGIWSDIGYLTVQRPSRFPPPTKLDIPQSRSVDMTRGIRLLGWGNLPTIVRPGERFPFDLYWQALSPSPNDGTIQVLATSKDGNTVILWQGMPVMNTYPFSAWHTDELVVDRHRWRLPTDLSAGTYVLSVAVGDQKIDLGNFTVLEVSRQFDIPEITHSLDLNLGDTVRLLGYDLSSEVFMAGDELHLTLYWQAIAITDLPFTVFVHVVNADGVNITQRDLQPRQNTYPVALWLPGEVVEDTYTMTIPEATPTGTYQIRVGMYLQASGLRLGIKAGDTSIGDYWYTEITVRERT